MDELNYSIVHLWPLLKEKTTQKNKTLINESLTNNNSIEVYFIVGGFKYINSAECLQKFPLKHHDKFDK